MTLVLTDDAKEFLIKKGSNLDYGARPLRRAIENFIEDPLSEELLKGEFQGTNLITVDGFKNDEGKVRRLSFVGTKIEEVEDDKVTVPSGEAEDSEESAE